MTVVSESGVGASATEHVANETINDDLYAFGLTVSILGTVTRVGRDLLVATGNASISGPVTRNMLVSISEQHYAWYVVEGLALLGLVSLVPIVGGLIGLLAVVFGLGALTLAVFDAYRAQPLVAQPPQQIVSQPIGNGLVVAPSRAS